VKEGAPIVFATGGTGGHVYPALATALELRARGREVLFLGQADGMEARLVPAEGFPFRGVRAGKWHRGRPNPREAYRAFLGLKDAVRFLREERPALVMGFGGFASFPGLAAARLLGLPYALHEQNVYPGKVTRWFASGARAVAAAHEEVAAHLSVTPHYVGMPIRERRVPKGEARRRLGLPEEGPLTLVMGGSQGSLALNEAVPSAFLALPEDLRGVVLHSSGARHVGTVRRRTQGLPNYRVDAYVDAVLAWSAADLGVTRAGTSTLAEAAFHGVPLLMVPLPSAAENHQLHNAQAVALAGAGQVVQERQLASLADAWRALLEPDARARAALAARKRSPQGAAARLADLIEGTLTPTPTRPLGDSALGGARQEMR